MNLQNLPNSSLLENGDLSKEWYNFFAMNFQNMILFFGQTGHLVPRRTSAEIKALSTNQNLGRSLFNPETGNEMTNATGVYKNNTQNQVVPNALNPGAATANRVEFYADADKQLSANVNGENKQIMTSNVDHPVSFSSDGTNLFVKIGGTTKQVVLA